MNSGRGRGRSSGGDDNSGSRGRSSRPSSHSSHLNRPVGADGSSFDEKSFSSRNARSQNRGRNWQPNSRRGCSGYPNSGASLVAVYRPKTPLGNGLSTPGCVDKPNESLEDSMSSTERLLQDQNAPSCSSIGSRYPNSGASLVAVHRSKTPLGNGLSTPDCVGKPNDSLEDSMSSTERLLHDQNAPSCSSIGSNQSNCSVASNSVNESDSALMPPNSVSQDTQPNTTSVLLEEGARDGAAHLDFSGKLNIVHLQNQNQPRLPFEAGINHQPSQENCSSNAASGGDSEQQAVVEPFDICLPNTGTTFKLKPSLLVKNREKRNEVMHTKDGLHGQILRSGMVLLKKYLPLLDQIKILKLCRSIGLGPGGFYQPVYWDGGRMHLKMMSLGKSWNPDRSEYVDCRPVDGATAPIFPAEFHPLVERAIKDSHVLIERKHNLHVLKTFCHHFHQTSVL